MPAPVVGLLRHALTESWASVSHVFGGIERAVRRRFTPRLLPAYIHALPRAQRRPAIAELLRGCDVAVVDAARGAVESFELRDRERLALPLVFHALGDLPRGAVALRTILPRLRRCDTVVLSSSADRAILRNLVTELPARVIVVPFGVDPRGFRPAPAAERRAVRSALGYADGDVVLVSCGRVTSEKNVHALLGLFGQLQRTRPELRLLVIGPVADVAFHEFGTGPHALDQVFARITAKYGCADRVQWLGFQPTPSLPALYSAADIFVNLTLHHDENFGFSNVEAMSCGLPVVATAWGGGQDTIRDGEVGYHVPAVQTPHGTRADLHAASLAIARLAADPHARAVMGRAARRHVVARLSARRFEDRICAELDHALGHALGRRTGSRPRVGAYTPLGRSLARAFVNHDAGGLPGRPRFDHPGAALYRRLIRPYASHAASTRLVPASVVALTSPLVERAGRRLRIADPLWPIEVDDLRAHHGAVVSLLDDRGPLTVTALRAALEPRFAAGDVDTAVADLVGAGALLHSTVRADGRPA